MKYVCQACGFIYDEDLGDPNKGIKPGTNSKTSQMIMSVIGVVLVKTYLPLNNKKRSDDLIALLISLLYTS